MDLPDLTFIEKMPKVELHLHIEGTLEADLLFSLSERNNVKIPYKTLEDVKNAYNFTNLESFLELYYAGMNVLVTEQDFYELGMAYMTRAHAQNIRHVEPFFDPQGHLPRGVSFKTFTTGLRRAFDEAEKKWGITCIPIMCFLRHLSEEDAFKTWEASADYRSFFGGVGLDSSENGNPPSKFKNVFAEVKAAGLKITAHAGEEGPVSYIKEAINILKVDRIDHGVHCLEDENITKTLVDTQMALTLCPLSNVRLKGYETIDLHPIKAILEKGILATVNSDDPAYFGGYLNDNYIAIFIALGLSKQQIFQLGKNSIIASFLPQDSKDKLLVSFNEHVSKYS